MFTDAHSTVTAVDGDRYPIRPPNIVRWQSGPMHGIANPESRQFKSDSHFQQQKVNMDLIPGYHAKTADACRWVINNYEHVTDNQTVVAWVASCKEYLKQLN